MQQSAYEALQERRKQEDRKRLGLRGYKKHPKSITPTEVKIINTSGKGSDMRKLLGTVRVYGVLVVLELGALVYHFFR